MCSVSNQTPVHPQLAIKPASSSYSDTESFLKKTHLNMAQPLIKMKRYSHKFCRVADNVAITNNLSNNNDNQKTFSVQANVLSSHVKKPSKLQPKHTVSISSSLDTSFMTFNGNEYESRCLSSLVSPRCNRHYNHRKSYRQATDTDELLRKVSVQLMRAQTSDVSKKSDKNKISDVTKNVADSQRSITMSSIESPKLGLDNDTSLTSDDCGQFSGSSTPDQQVLSQGDTISEDQLRLACEHIIEQQRKAWIAFKKAKKNGRRSLTRPALDHETHPLKENHISNINCDTINIRCKNEAVLLKVSNNSEEGHISSEQFDSGHGSSEEHEIISKTEWFPATGNKNAWAPICRPYYRYHVRRQKGHCPGSKQQTTCNTSTDSVPSPLEITKANLGEQRLLSYGNNTEFKQSSYTTRYPRPGTSKTESIPEPSTSPSPSLSPSYLSSHICSGPTSSCSSSSSSSSSMVNIEQVATSCYSKSSESACTVLIPTEEPLLDSSSPQANNKSPRQTVQPGKKINIVSLSSSSSSLTPSLSHTTSKNSTKKENNKSNVKLYSTLTRSCISCGFIANACSKIVQIRKTISGKTSRFSAD